MEARYSMNWGVIKLNIPLSGSDTFNVVVAELYEEEHTRYKTYWVKCGGLIDATVRPVGVEITGIGAKNYREEIREAIDIFQHQLLRHKIEIESKVRKGEHLCLV